MNKMKKHKRGSALRLCFFFHLRAKIKNHERNDGSLIFQSFRNFTFICHQKRYISEREGERDEWTSTFFTDSPVTDGQTGTRKIK
jgi:hypothetical protein